MAGGTRVCLGQIGAAHGVRGEVRLRSFTAEPAAITKYGPLEAEDGRVFEIETLRPAKSPEQHHFVARLAGIADRSAAERLANIKLYVPRERLPDAEGARRVLSRRPDRACRRRSCRPTPRQRRCHPQFRRRRSNRDACGCRRHDRAGAIRRSNGTRDRHCSRSFGHRYAGVRYKHASPLRGRPTAKRSRQ